MQYLAPEINMTRVRCDRGKKIDTGACDCIDERRMGWGQVRGNGNVRGKERREQASLRGGRRGEGSER